MLVNRRINMPENTLAYYKMEVLPRDVVFEIATYLDYVTLTSIRYLSTALYRVYEQRSTEFPRKEKIRLAIIHDEPSLYPEGFYPMDLDCFRYGCGRNLLPVILSKMEDSDVWYLVKRSTPIQDTETLRLLIDKMGDVWLNMLSGISTQEEFIQILLRALEINTEATRRAIKVCLRCNAKYKNILRVCLFATKIKSYLKDETCYCLPG